MIKPKHSPGPFIALKYPDANHWTVSNSKGAVASKVKTEADAKLFAAAPKMLAALKEIVHEEKRDDAIDPHRGTGHDIEGLQAIIAEAEGGV